jgi:ABC-type amino acid transport substrate-binding protein
VKKIIVAVLIAFAGAAPSFAAELQGVLKKIKATKTITLGYSESAVPFSFVGNDNRPQGYSVDLCKLVADGIQRQLGLNELNVKWVKVDVATRIEAVVKGTIDIECGSTTHTLSREERVDFSSTTLADGASLLSKSRAKIAAVSGLAGKKVAVIPGTTTETVLKKALAEANVTAEIVPVKAHVDGINAVREDRADAYISDRAILIGLLLGALDVASYSLSDDMISFEPHALMMKRDADLRLAVNRELAQLYRSGKIMDVYGRWYGAFGEPTVLLRAVYFLNAYPE